MELNWWWVLWGLVEWRVSPVSSVQVASAVCVFSWCDVTKIQLPTATTMMESFNASHIALLTSPGPHLRHVCLSLCRLTVIAGVCDVAWTCWTWRCADWVEHCVAMDVDEWVSSLVGWCQRECEKFLSVPRVCTDSKQTERKIKRATILPSFAWKIAIKGVYMWNICILLYCNMSVVVHDRLPILTIFWLILSLQTYMSYGLWLVSTVSCMMLLLYVYVAAVRIAWLMLGDCHWYSAFTVALLFFLLNYLPPTKEEVYVFAHVRLSICEQDYPKRRAWIWMKHCVSQISGHGQTD